MNCVQKKGHKIEKEEEAHFCVVLSSCEDPRPGISVNVWSVSILNV